MDSTERKQRLADIKNVDLVDYLARIGYLPHKKYGGYYMYRSPLRDEKTASFKVNLINNSWVDFGESSPKGGPLNGDLISFVMRYHNWTFDDVLREFNQGTLTYHKPIYPKCALAAEKKSKLIILDDQPLHSPALLNYLKSRAINADVAGRFCREVDYEINGRKYYAIGFKNDLGGFELRNAIVKLSSAPKGITTIDNGAKEVAVFEGFMDYFSFRMMHPDLPENALNYVVLNSIVFFEKARAFLEQHEKVHLYLDQDKVSIALTQKIVESNKDLYVDESKLYAGKKDLNKWLTTKGRMNRRLRKRRGLR